MDTASGTAGASGATNGGGGAAAGTVGSASAIAQSSAIVSATSASGDKASGGGGPGTGGASVSGMASSTWGSSTAGAGFGGGDEAPPGRVAQEERVVVAVEAARAGSTSTHGAKWHWTHTLSGSCGGPSHSTSPSPMGAWPSTGVAFT